MVLLSCAENLVHSGRGRIRVAEFAQLFQPEHRVNALREDYARMQEIFFGEPPEFNAMMAGQLFYLRNK